jgi:PhnB protein
LAQQEENIMKLNPYLSFNGTCDAAFTFYEKCLGGKIEFKMTWGQSPMAAQTPPELLGRIMHVTLQVGSYQLQGADAPPQYFSQPQGFCVSLDFDTPPEAERVFKALSENGQIKMPLQETFWAARFGMFVDQFGTPWMINCGKQA